MFFDPSKSGQREKICNIVVSTTSDHIKIKFKMQNTSQEPPVSPKALTQDFQDMDIIALLK